MILRRIARPLLSSIFVYGGLDSLRRPTPLAERAEPVIDLVAEAAAPVAQHVAASTTGAVDLAVGAVDEAAEPIPANPDGAVASAVGAVHDVGDAVHDVATGRPLPFEGETYVRANGAVQVAAGLLLATGRVPRIAAAVLAATLVPTTFSGHRFWELDGDDRAAQQVQFAKNLSILGGLLLAAADTEGEPGLAWRARQAAHTMADRAHDVGEAAADVADRAHLPVG